MNKYVFNIYENIPAFLNFDNNKISYIKIFSKIKGMIWFFKINI